MSLVDVTGKPLVSRRSAEELMQETLDKLRKAAPDVHIEAVVVGEGLTGKKTNMVCLSVAGQRLYFLPAPADPREVAAIATALQQAFELGQIHVLGNTPAT